MIPPTIKLKNCIMRPFYLKDAEPLFEISRDQEVIKYIPWKETPPYKRIVHFDEQRIKHWKDYPYGWWALENLHRQEFMGWCGLQHLPETGETEVGYLLGKGYW